MEMDAKIDGEGNITYNGTKIYTTNGAVADYFATYGVTDQLDPRRSMMLTLFKRGDEGLMSERLHIPGAHGVGVGKITYNNVKVPKDRMIAEPGEGYRRLFRGLTPERIAIIGSALAGVWGAIAHGVIYTNLRTQFKKPLFKFQGISHVLDDLYARVQAYTTFALKIAEIYDTKVGNVIRKGGKPDMMAEGQVAVAAASGKYILAKMAHEAAYEVVQLMGGRGAINEPGSNNGINRGENLSRLAEVLGGHRNIQLMIINMGLKATAMMPIQPIANKGKKKAEKKKIARYKAWVEKAEQLIAKDGEFMGDTREYLERCASKLKTAIENKDKIEIDAYGKAIPRAFSKASKAAHIARKKA